MKNSNEDLVKKEFERGQNSLKAAQKLLEEQLLADAVSRAYYACLHTAKPALLTENITVSSHKAVVTMFGKYLVKTAKIEKEYGIVLREEKEEREVGDYDVLEVFEIDRARQRVFDAERFVERISQFLKETARESK